MSHQRLSWEHYFMALADQVAQRSTCPKRKVGAILVRDHTLLSTGYNGSIRGLPHCTEVGCDMEQGHCVATIHAEANALLQAALNGVNIQGAELYTTSRPCWQCFKLLANVHIRTIYYRDDYPDQRVDRYAALCHISLIRVPFPETP